MCGKPVKNKNITKDGHYFCGNDCEAEYWHKYVSKIKDPKGNPQE
jgi:hypothetical protein